MLVFMITFSIKKKKKKRVHEISAVLFAVQIKCLENEVLN